MALTYGTVRTGVDVYGCRYAETDVTFDSAYPTGGIAVPLGALGLVRVNRVEITFIEMPEKVASAYTTHGRQVVPVLTDPSAPLLKVYTSNNTEAGNASDQSQIVSRIRFIQGR